MTTVLVIFPKLLLHLVGSQQYRHQDRDNHQFVRRTARDKRCLRGYHEGNLSAYSTSTTRPNRQRLLITVPERRFAGPDT